MTKGAFFILIITTCFSVIGCEASKKTTEFNKVMMDSIEGQIIYREKIALPDHAEVSIAIEDVSLMDAPSTIIAKQTFTTDGEQIPFDFRLSYDANKIKDNHRYSMSARITIDGKLHFITDTMNAVLTDPAQTKSIDLFLIKVP